MNIHRSLRLVVLGLSASTFVNADCNPPDTSNEGNLEVIVNGNVAFKSATGWDESFFSSDNALGPAQMVEISSVQQLLVHYNDGFSTFNDPNLSPPVGSSQEEILVLARDPVEYRTTLEHIGGAGDPFDFGENLIWVQETFAPGDLWPIVPMIGAPQKPNGVTLPDAVHFPFPNKSTTPDADWPMTQALFTGSSSTPFAGAAASFGGSIKGLSVIQRGLCSYSQPLQSSLGGLASIPLSANVLGLGYDAVLGASSFVSYAPKGGLVVMLYVAATEPQPLPIPPFFQQPTFTRNVTYFFTLDDGIVSLGAPTFNIDSGDGLDFYALGGLLDGKLNNDVPNTVKLAALEGEKGSFTAGQAQPIPSGLESAVNAEGKVVKCNDTTQLRPAACFVGCDDANGIVMAQPNTWVPPMGNMPPEDVGDASKVDPASWHDMSYLNTAYNKLRFAILASAPGYPGMTQCGPTALANAATENLPLSNGNRDGAKYHNLRCNFYPQYVEPTLRAGLASLAKPVPVPAPVAEFITRADRLNVFPDSIEAVFVDGPDFNHLSPSLFGTPAAAADCSTASGASEPVATFMVLWALSNGTLGTKVPAALGSLCERKAETYTSADLGQSQLGIAPFAHGLFK